MEYVGESERRAQAQLEGRDQRDLPGDSPHQIAEDYNQAQNRDLEEGIRETQELTDEPPRVNASKETGRGRKDAAPSLIQSGPPVRMTTDHRQTVPALVRMKQAYTPGFL